VTDLLDTLIAFIVAGLLNLALVARIRSSQPRAEAAFLARVYAATLMCRVALAVLLNRFAADSAFAAGFWGDSGTYDAGGYTLARYWRGESATTSLTQALSGYGYVYLIAGLYYVFGRNRLLVQLLNCTTGAVTMVAVYAIAARLFGRPVARWVALFMAFFPQMLFWSAGMYKDPTILLCIAVCMYAVIRLKDGFSLTFVLLFLGAALGLLTLRFYVFYFVVTAAVGTFAFGGRGRFAGRLVSCAVLIAGLAGAFKLGVRQDALEAQASYMTLNQVQVTRADQAMWGNSAYGAEYDVTTPSGALRALPVGLVYLLFAPFPWAVGSTRQLMAVPETVVWYALMPAFARGFVWAVRHRLRDVLPIVAFMVTLTLAYALMQGNVGTAYRQRTQVTMFFFVFMAVGLIERRRRRGAGEVAGDLGDSPRPAATVGLGVKGPINDRGFGFLGEVDSATRA
jgi:hypothetical protein